MIVAVFLTFLAFLSATAKEPVSCPSPENVHLVIDSYVDDVAHVNSIIERLSSIEDPHTFEGTALLGLLYENHQTSALEILGIVCNPDNAAVYSETVRMVRSARQQVVGAMKNFQGGPATAQHNLHSINHLRCCTILPGLDNIFSIAADTLGVESATAPRPQACNVIQCKGL